jgi:hypothetical protein
MSSIFDLLTFEYFFIRLILDQRQRPEVSLPKNYEVIEFRVGRLPVNRYRYAILKIQAIASICDIVNTLKIFSPPITGLIDRQPEGYEGETHMGKNPLRIFYNKIIWK